MEGLYKKSKDLIDKLNDEARRFDPYDYGLPVGFHEGESALQKIVLDELRPKPKDLVVHLLGERYGKISVRRGRGTAQGWLYIKTEQRVPSEVQDPIEKMLVYFGCCGTYLTDTGCSRERWEPNVSWNQ